ncbi:MAG: GNAT family N-acetyltransferase, partial [Alphaproteobacteria bacterium]
MHQRACSIAYRFMGWSYSEAQVRRWYATKRADWDWGRVAVHGDDIVAFAAAIRGHLDQLFVDPACQRGGIGRTLLQAMLDRGIRPVTLTVYAENLPARAF